ncbi:hypothetical protein MPER_01457, partial [Moniliophthora perniciosa FA553]
MTTHRPAMNSLPATPIIPSLWSVQAPPADIVTCPQKGTGQRDKRACNEECVHGARKTLPIS